MENLVIASSKTELMDRDLAYWRKQLSGEPSELNLPFDHPRQPLSKPEYKTYNFTIPGNLYQSLMTFSKHENASIYGIMMTVFKILMYRYSSEEDITVGTFASNNNLFSVDNTLILRSQFDENMSFQAALQDVKKVIQDAYNHQNVSFTKLVEELSPTNPLFKVMMNMENGQQSGLFDYEHFSIDLSLNIKEVYGELDCYIVYNENIFEEETMKRLEGHFNNLLAGAVANPLTQIALLPLLTESEKHQLLIEWNDTKADYPRNSSIPQLFEEQVELFPDNIALIFGDSKLTYRELNNRSNQIANYLLNLNIQNEQLVAICLNRSFDMIASMLGVLKAGGAYVPIDLSYPSERIGYMLEDSSASFVISTESIEMELPAVNSRIILLDKEVEAISSQPENIINNSNPESLAYVMYTSGSTGKPKGVVVAQRGIVRLVKNISYAKLGPEETILNRAPIAFDASTFEIYGSLLNGAKLAILNSQKPSFNEIALAIKQNQVTTLRSTPGILNVLLEDYGDYLGSLRQILSAGEALPVWLAHKCLAKLKSCKLINAYGPTENTVSTTSYHVKQISSNDQLVPIGRPIANDKVFILDKYHQPVPIGVIGELYFSGDGIARGYLNQDDLTSERFLSNPFNEILRQKKLYKSGDLVRYRHDSNIEYLGRADDQVKIRGFRIELGEIESIIGLFPGVKQAVAGTFIGKDGTKELVAYIVMNEDAHFDQQLLRSYARGKLPQPMIPTYFIELKEFPVTPVGKIDRKKLPAPTIAVVKDKIVLPRNKTEEQLRQVWETILDVNPIGVTDNYFELGGNSLQAMRVFAEIEKTFNKRLPVSIIFQEDTIEKLAKYIIADHQENEDSSSIVAIQPIGTKTPLFCIHGGGGEVLVYKEFAAELGNNQPLYGLRFTNKGNNTNITVESLAEKYLKDIREVQPVGPYSIFGYCFGGVIAYEIAQKLIQSGQKVSLLTILNFENPKTRRIEVKNELSYKKIIFDNLNRLHNMPLKKKIKFFKQKVSNAIKLLNKQDRSSTHSDLVNTRAILSKPINAYKAKPYSGNLLLIRSTINVEQNEKHGWETVGSGKVHEYHVPAKHEELIKGDNTKLVVNFLKKHLDT